MKSKKSSSVKARKAPTKAKKATANTGTHKCAYRGCKERISKEYRYCFKHKDTIYTDTCIVHGKTKFQNRECLKCKEMKNSIYSVEKRGKSYYINGHRINMNTNKYKPLKKYIEIFSDHSKNNALKHFVKLSKGPGIYVIMGKSDKGFSCLYVGQSFDVVRRMTQHKELIAEAKKDKKEKKKYIEIPAMYYEIAKYNTNNVKFRCAIRFPYSYFDQLDFDQKLLLLAIGEQWAMDTYQPSLNKVQARMTKIKGAKFNKLRKTRKKRK